MKFVSWNVNGLRACIQKGFLEEFHKLNADFFCLQETKLSEGQLQLDLPGYEQYWCYAEKKGYSGTAIFTKHTPLSVTYGIGVPELDNEGRVITLEYREFYLVTCYTPNAQRGLARISHRLKWDDAFRGYLRKLDESKPVILCGDLNVAHKEIDLKNPGSNRNNAGFSDQERDSFQKTLDLGFTDTFRHLYPDATGRYSWWSYMFHARENNAGWRIDYFLVSDRLKEQIYRADIHSEILGSDHCPVSLELDILVNGGLWSPEYIPPAPPTADPTPEKEPKASPVNGKAFAAIIPILLFVIAGFIAVGWIFGDQFVPITDLPGVKTLEFETTVYSTPLEIEGVITEDAPIAVSSDTSAVLTDGIDYFFVKSTDGLDEANLFLRVTGKNIVPEDYSVSLASTTDTLNQSGFLSTVSMVVISAVPYYSDFQMTQCEGWIIWGSTAHLYPVEASLAVERLSDQVAYHGTVSLIPYLDAEACRQATTFGLLLHLSTNPDIYNRMTAPLKEYSPISSYYDSYDTRLYSLIFEYPAMDAFVQRSDAVEQLMTASYGKIDFYNILLSTLTFRAQMSAQEEVDYLTGQYTNAGKTYPFETGNVEPLSPLSTEELLRKALAEDPGLWLAQSSTEEVRQLVYDYIRQNSAFLQHFEQRDDAIAVLMGTDIFQGLSVSVNGTNISMDTIPYHLLSMKVYRQKMTPFEEALFLTNNYITCPFDPVSVGVDIGVDLSHYDTAAIIDHVLYYNIGETLESCSGTETMYYVCLFNSRTNTYLAELLAREDTISTLESKISLGAYKLQYNLLYDALTYKPENTYTDKSAKELVEILVNDPSTLDNVAQLVQLMGISYSEACAYYPLLQEMISRDCFMSLRSAVILDRTPDESLGYLLKQLPYMQDLSGVSSSDLLFRVDYVDGLKEQLLTAVNAQASFEELCAIHPFVQELLNREQVSAALIRHGLRVQPDYTFIFNHFLMLPEIQEDINNTPFAKVCWLTGKYANPVNKVPFDLTTDKNPADMTTQEIIAFLNTEGFDLKYCMSLCSKHNELVAMYKLLRDYAPVLVELETRSDAYDLMIATYPWDLENSCVSYLYELWPEILAYRAELDQMQVP